MLRRSGVMKCCPQRRYCSQNNVYMLCSDLGPDTARLKLESGYRYADVSLFVLILF